jgi:hypothetical protein
MRRSPLAALVAASLAIAGLVLVVEPAHAVVSNALVNPGFETGDLTGWQTYSSADADADFVESPSRYGTYTGVHRKSAPYEVYTYQVLTGLTNGTYAVSARFKSSGGQTYTTFAAKNFGGTDVSVPIPKPGQNEVPSWVRVQLPDVAVSNGQLQVGIYSKSAADKWLDFDDVRVDFIAPNPAETTEGTNLLTNPSFEATTGWLSSGTAARVTSNANSGSAAVKLGPATGLTYQDVKSGFSPGQTMVLTAYGKSATQGGTALVGVQALDSSGRQLSDERLPFFATTYGRNSTTSVLPAGTTTLRVYAYKEDGDRKSLVYVDDVRLYVSNGTQYYVDATSGRDDQDGTSPSAAWKTLDRANKRTWAPGDSLLLKGGQIFDGGLDFGSLSSGTMNHPITVSSYGNGRATINATTQHGILLQDASGFHVYGLDLTGPGATKNVWNGIFATNQTASTQRGLIGIDNVTISGFYLGINIASRHGKGFGPISILNSTTRDNFREGTNVFGYDGQGQEADVWYSHGIFTRAYIGYVTSYNNHEWSGILIGNTDDAMIEHSVVHDIGDTAKSGPGPVGIWTIGTERGTVQFNSSSNVGSSNPNKLDGDGYDISWNNTHALYQYNLAFNNEGPGFLADDNKVTSPAFVNATMRYNVSQGNCQDSIRCGELYLYGQNQNTQIYNNSTRVTRTDKSGIRFAGEWQSKAAVTGSVATTVRNNIFSVVRGARTVDITAADAGSTGWGDAGDITFQGNLYWADGASLAINDKGTAYSSLAAWRAAGRETLGLRNTGLQADPLYTNPNPSTLGSASNLKIGNLSPAKGAALNLSALFGISPGAIDYFGTVLARGGGLDIGAHERY